MEADFFDHVLRNDAPETIESSIQYYTMGAGRWNTTKVWPPEGFSTERLYFAEHNTLNTARPSAVIARDSYTVDFTASTGEKSRWAYRVWRRGCGVSGSRPGGQEIAGL